MGWFIVQRERKTWTKYVVEAENEVAAAELCEEGKYLGYLDGDNTESAVVGGPFASDKDALEDIVSYVEG